MSEALQTLRLADFRVKKYVYQCLLQEYRETEGARRSPNWQPRLPSARKSGLAPTQITKGLEDARLLLRQSVSREQTIDDDYLQTQIDSCRALQEASNKRLRSLYNSGIIQPIHHGIEFRFAPPAMQAAIRNVREKEFKGMEKALEKTHRAVLNLKGSLSTLLMESEDQAVPLKFLNEMVKDLQTDRGPDHPDSGDVP